MRELSCTLWELFCTLCACYVVADVVSPLIMLLLMLLLFFLCCCLLFLVMSNSVVACRCSSAMIVDAPFCVTAFLLPSFLGHCLIFVPDLWYIMRFDFEVPGFMKFLKWLPTCSLYHSFASHLLTTNFFKGHPLPFASYLSNRTILQISKE